MKRQLLLLAPLLVGCVIGNNKVTKPSDLEPEWHVSTVRLLAGTGTPPEVAPGETVSFDKLMVDPNGVIEAVIWMACDSESSFGCELDLEGLDFENITPEDLLERGVIGFEPFLPPAMTIPLDFLDDMAPQDRLEGRALSVQMMAVPDLQGQDLDNVDFATVKAATFDLIVSEATTPNNNPFFTQAWWVDGVEVDLNAVVEIDSDQPYELGVRIPDNAIEEYEFVNSAGELELRTEEPWVKWYATAGSELEDTTLHPYTDAYWRAPYCPTTADEKLEVAACTGIEGTWFSVVRDRRGGMAWVQQAFHVIPGPLRE